MTRQPPRSSQHGAAMVEFIVGAVFVLAPMYLAVQALGKFADAQATAQSAARYSAWEKTVWFEDKASKFHAINSPNQKSGAQIRSEILVRVINDRRSPLKYADTDKGATTFAHGIDPLWFDTGGVEYIKDPAKFTATSTWKAPSKDLLGGAIGLINKISVPSITGTLAPPVPTNTLAETNIRFDKLAGDSGVYKRLWSKAQGLPEDWMGLDFEGRSAILSNGWASNAYKGTHDMVSESVPTASGLGTALKTAAFATMAAWDPLLMVPTPRLDLGKVEPDVVPKDRLK